MALFRVFLLISLSAMFIAPSWARTEEIIEPAPVMPVNVEPAKVERGTPPSVSKLADGLMDAVVNIATTQTVNATEQGENVPSPQVPENSPFDDYFKDFFSKDQDGQKKQSRKMESLGSGFVIDAKEGFVVTNNHVIDNADTIEVNFADGTKLDAKLIGKDAKTDLALLKVDATKKKLTAVDFGNSENAKIGDWVMAIGNPFGLGGTVTLGIVSARNRDINAGPYDDFIQTDAAINRGNSGGPLFNMDGKVIGINTAIISPTGGSIGLGFAIPSELAISVISQLREFGETRRGWLAVRIQPVTQEIADSAKLQKVEGALIAGKIADDKVDNRALKMGDIVLKFAGKPVKEARNLPRIVAESPVNSVVDVVVWRDGREETVKVKLGLLKEKETAKTSDDADKNEDNNKEAPKTEVLGMTLAEMTPELRKQEAIVESVNGVVIIAVRQSSAADEKRLRKGDVIVDINQEKVKTPAEVVKRIDALKALGRKNALFLIASMNGELRFLTLSLD